MRAAAVICARNEEVHIERVIEDTIAEGLDVVLIDNDSTDDTVPLARRFLGHGLLRIERLPWKGLFSWQGVLEAKRKVIDGLEHDWVMHLDADEWASAPDEGVTLLEGLAEADAAGATSVNFNEFVFIPGPGEDVYSKDHKRRMTTYYFLEPSRPRLLRAWRNGLGLDNRRYGGHELTGGARIYERDFPLRHYVALSADHARAKYVGRRYSLVELERGWHRGRQVFSERLEFPEDDDPRLRTLPHWSSKQYDLSMPARGHYWDWWRVPRGGRDLLKARARAWARRKLITRYVTVPARPER
jgi:glycosyltransferase involved in cell wall biosynthesis